MPVANQENGMTDRWAREWEKFGRADPYFGVCNLNDNRGSALTGDAARRFWDSGEREVGSMAAVIEAEWGHVLAPRRALDFGCGVGRLTIPLARRAGQVVAVDVSPAMIERAQRHVHDAGLTNVQFAVSDPALAQVTGPLDFVMSFIVFQHIPPELGYQLAAAILQRLAPGGFGALHFTVQRRASWLRRAVHSARRRSPAINAVVNVLQGRSPSAPMMPMFEYDRDTLHRLLRDAGCHDVRERATDHGGHLGVILFFHKEAAR
jgi:2-polyprenyl-3-methyl-5-hydroxy-6-metoxy-1,4-benzoquinol methylase